MPFPSLGFVDPADAPDSIAAVGDGVPVLVNHLAVALAASVGLTSLGLLKAAEDLKDGILLGLPDTCLNQFHPAHNKDETGDEEQHELPAVEGV